MNKDRIIFGLFKALDDIDTTSDIYKGNDKARCNHIDSIIKSITVDREYISQLYDKYYKKEEDILTTIFKEVTKWNTT